MEKKVNLGPLNYFQTKSPNTIVKVQGDDTGLLFFEAIAIGEQVLGFSPPGQFMMLIPDRAESEEQFTVVVAHEFGHFLNLLHTESLMNSSAKEQSRCLTKYDLLQFCELHSCNVNDTTPTCL